MLAQTKAGSSSVKNCVTRNFTKFTRITCTRVSYFAEAYNFSKKDTLAQVFSCEPCDISKNTFFTEHTEHIWATASAHSKLFFCEKLFEDCGPALLR